MTTARHLIISFAIAAIGAVSVHAQAPGSPFRIDATKLVLQQAPASGRLHPAAKGALIGAAIGAGTWGGIGLWYCTIGPNEAGECSNSSTWLEGIPLFAGVGAAVGALIGALR